MGYGRIQHRAMKTKQPSKREIVPLRQVKKAAILAAVKQLDGDLSLAAEKLEIGITTLYRKLKEYGAWRLEKALRPRLRKG
jgi:transcriptional regulator of acetoin/glycerol metabolism